MKNENNKKIQNMSIFSWSVGGGLKIYNYNKLTFSEIRNQASGNIHKNLLGHILHT
ncbi:hypothetical protein LOR_67c18920 [Legionella oakridgensis RV-2-2007]|nr:hypothetical protein LOR_67c18920 [Legionella oakridgensis RV-2-2007]